MVFSENKKVLFDYEILEKFQAGIVLFGFEVKSIRLGRMNLRGSFIIIRNNEAYLIGADIPSYQPKNTPKDYDSKRSRKLLLTKKELDYLIGKSKTKSLTMAPLKVYNVYNKIKLEFGIVRGKKKYEKREKIKKREIEREIKRWG